PAAPHRQAAARVAERHLPARVRSTVRRPAARRDARAAGVASLDYPMTSCPGPSALVQSYPRRIWGAATKGKTEPVINSPFAASRGYSVRASSRHRCVGLSDAVHFIATPSWHRQELLILTSDLA